MRAVGPILSRVAAVILWGIGPPACSTELKGVKMNNVLGYAPDGDHVVVATEGASLQLVELRSRRVVWDRPLPGADVLPAQVVRYSAGGGLFVVVQSPIGRGPGRYTTIDAASGGATGTPRDVPALMASRVNPRQVAVSDDGRILVTVLEDGGVQFFEQPGGRPLYTIPSGGSPFDFQAGTHVLAAQIGDDRVNRTLVVRQGAGPDGAWTEAVAFPGSFTHAWAGHRLAVAPPEGLQVWDGQGVRTLATWVGKPGKLFALGATSDLVAAATEDRLDVHDVARGAVVFSKSNLGKVWDVALRGDLLVVLVERKDWKIFALDFNLRTGAAGKEKALGASQEVKSWTMPEVARQQMIFFPLLLPQGKYVDLTRDDQHQFVRLAD